MGGVRSTLGEVALVMRGELVGADSSVITSGAATDSRRVVGSELFFALPGELFDGHDFVSDALSRHASACVVQRPIDGPSIVVEDPAAALTRLAGHVRDVVDPIVVGITGSTGKTSTKDLAYAVVSSRFPVVASERSFNNEVGVPLTLLSAKNETEVVICEMGSRGKGQIASLCEIARPQVGIVTNVGVTHYEQFGSKQAVAEAKGELIASLPEGGTAICNFDDPAVMGMRSLTEASCLTFGNDGADVSTSRLRLDARGRPTFRLSAFGQSAVVSLEMSGRHQAANAAAAAALGISLGLTVEECASALSSAKGSAWRMEVSQEEDRSGALIVNDAYNANPASVRAALQTCAEILPKNGRLIVVLGYMAELGEISDHEHRQVGAAAAGVCTRLIVVGRRASAIAAGAREAGLEDVVQVERPEDVADSVGLLRQEDILLVKGSRVAGLEKVPEMIKAGGAG